MSPSGMVMTRLVKPDPGPAVEVRTMFAPTRRSVGFAVTATPLLLVVLLPAAAAVLSTEFAGSIPQYSRMRMSGYCAAGENATVTRLAPALAAFMFLA